MSKAIDREKILSDLKKTLSIFKGEENFAKETEQYNYADFWKSKQIAINELFTKIERGDYDKCD